MNPASAQAKKRAGGVLGREAIKRRKTQETEAESNKKYATVVELHGLGAAKVVLKQFEPFRGDVYHRSKYEDKVAAYKAGKGPEPEHVPKYDVPPKPFSVVFPAGLFTLSTCEDADAVPGIQIVIGSQPEAEDAESDEEGDDKLKSAAKPRGKTKTTVSNLRNLKNALAKAEPAKQLLGAIGIERMDEFNAKVVAEVYKDKMPDTIWSLPKDGVALKGAGQKSEATNRVVAQATRALATLIERNVKRAAKEDSDKKVKADPNFEKLSERQVRKQCEKHARAFEDAEFAKLTDAVEADPRFLLKHAVTKEAFRAHMQADVPDKMCCLACGRGERCAACCAKGDVGFDSGNEPAMAELEGIPASDEAEEAAGDEE